MKVQIDYRGLMKGKDKNKDKSRHKEKKLQVNGKDKTSCNNYRERYIDGSWSIPVLIRKKKAKQSRERERKGGGFVWKIEWVWGKVK